MVSLVVDVCYLIETRCLTGGKRRAQWSIKDIVYGGCSLLRCEGGLEMMTEGHAGRNGCNPRSRVGQNLIPNPSLT